MTCLEAGSCEPNNALYTVQMRHSENVLDATGLADGPEELGDPVALGEELGDLKSWVTLLEVGS